MQRTFTTRTGEANVITIPKDGNCLYRAIANRYSEIFGNTFDHRAVRRDLAKFVDNNQDQVIMRAAILSNLEPYRQSPNDIKQYIKAQYIDGTWGGADIILAAAEYYGMNITIHHVNTTNNNITVQTFTPNRVEDAVAETNVLFRNSTTTHLISHACVWTIMLTDHPK